ncbi:bifunctional riboflavin kinase/FAD synthetase [Anaerolineales bacterium]
MANYTSFEEFPNTDTPSLVTIGVFDGLHIGHQELISSLVKDAKARGLRAVLVCFFPHPDRVIAGIQEPYYLLHPDTRATMLLEMGIDDVLTLKFTDELRHMRAKDFVQKLLKHLNMQVLRIGSDFALGYQREGNIDFLKQASLEYHFELEIIDLLHHDDYQLRYSSSEIRRLLSVGDMALVKTLLGRFYTIQGQVVPGDQRGRTIGFPTANISVWEELIVPQNGVYATFITIDAKVYQAVVNIGFRPTFDGQTQTIEAYILDFDQDIYGAMVQLEFVKQLRPEIKFNGINELIAQIQNDVQAARDILNTYPV